MSIALKGIAPDHLDAGIAGVSFVNGLGLGTTELITGPKGLDNTTASRIRTSDAIGEVIEVS